MCYLVCQKYIFWLLSLLTGSFILMTILAFGPFILPSNVFRPIKSKMSFHTIYNF